MAEGDDSARNVARQGLHNLGGPRAVVRLTAQLERMEDPAEVVNYLNSLRAEGSLSARRAVRARVEPMLRALEGEADGSSRLRQFVQVRRFEDCLGPGKLMEVVRGEPDLRTRFQMAGYLVRRPHRSPEAWDLLLEAARHPDLAVRTILFDSHTVLASGEGKEFYEAWARQEPDPGLRRKITERVEEGRRRGIRDPNWADAEALFGTPPWER